MKTVRIEKIETIFDSIHYFNEINKVISEDLIIADAVLKNNFNDNLGINTNMYLR